MAILTKNGKFVKNKNGGFTTSSALDERDYLCITADTAATIAFVHSYWTSTLPRPTLQYKINNGSWIDYIILQEGHSPFISLAAGDKCYWRGDNEYFSVDEDNYIRLKCGNYSGNIYASGNVMSLVDKSVTSTTIPSTMCFYYLFWGCTKLLSAPLLPATTLVNACYHSMFRGCTSLTTAPELPATTLADYCYDSMFWACKALTEIPNLPANTLANYCYAFMFENCESLTVIPQMPATTLADYCYEFMFYGCTSLTTPPALPITELKPGCYFCMFYDCTSLVKIPALPATTLVSKCYESMFRGCTSLQVSTSKTAAAAVAWSIPESGNFTVSYNQSDMFKSCAGSRGYVDFLPAKAGSNCVYYTQNTPIYPDIVQENDNLLITKATVSKTSDTLSIT